MAGAWCWKRDGLFGAALIVVGCILLSQVMAPKLAHGEGAKCANNTCKEIKYYWNCAVATEPPPPHVIGGIAQETESCFPCTIMMSKANPGRCDSGTGDTCTDTGMNQNLAFNIDVTKVCDCQTGWDAGGTVEGTATYTGTYGSDPAYPNIFTCKKPS